MINHLTWKRASVVFAAMSLAVVSGCSTIPSRKAEGLESGSVVVMPPRNVVQGGEPHPEGKDSGERFQEALVQQIDAKTSFRAVALEASDSEEFSHEEEIPPQEAIETAREMGKDYVLVATLGEFLDAAPMTFRSDYVTLKSAALYSTADEEATWELTEPFRLTGPNLQTYYRFLDQFADKISADLQTN